MAKAETLRERLEAAESELLELKKENAETPNFGDPSAVVQWYGNQILALMHIARRESALKRLRALSGALDSWSKMLRLANDSSELQTLKDELQELRQMVESERKTGVRGLVK